MALFFFLYKRLQRKKNFLSARHPEEGGSTVTPSVSHQVPFLSCRGWKTAEAGCVPAPLEPAPLLTATELTKAPNPDCGVWNRLSIGIRRAGCRRITPSLLPDAPGLSLPFCRMPPDPSPNPCPMPPEAANVKMSGTSEQLLAWGPITQPWHTGSPQRQGGGGRGEVQAEAQGEERCYSHRPVHCTFRLPDAA